MEVGAFMCLYYDFAHWTESFGNESCCGVEIAKRDLLPLPSLLLINDLFFVFIFF
jgi:hypothetical protein